MTLATIGMFKVPLCIAISLKFTAGLSLTSWTASKQTASKPTLSLSRILIAQGESAAPVPNSGVIGKTFGTLPVANSFAKVMPVTTDALVMIILVCAGSEVVVTLNAL